MTIIQAQPLKQFGISGPASALDNEIAVFDGITGKKIKAATGIICPSSGRLDLAEIRAKDGNGLKLYEDGGAGIFVKDGGNIGIGTTSPFAKLAITNTDAGHSFLVEDSTSPDSTPFVIDADGKVGIGTGAPGASLHIHGTTLYDALRISSSAQNWDFRLKANEDLVLMDGGEEFVIFRDSLRNVGIRGTGSAAFAPNSTLHIFSQDTTPVNIQFDGTAGASMVFRNDNYNYDFGLNGDGEYVITQDNDLTNPIFAIASGTPAGTMIIQNTGNLGIGTTAPSAKLDINSDIIRLRTAKTPASAGAAGNQGDECWDANYYYRCVATNTWKRTALTTW